MAAWLLDGMPADWRHALQVMPGTASPQPGSGDFSLAFEVGAPIESGRLMQAEQPDYFLLAIGGLPYVRRSDRGGQEKPGS